MRQIDIAGVGASDVAVTFENLTSSSRVFGPHDAGDLRGTEDPRVAYDTVSKLYHIFYTCYAEDGSARLCHVSSKNPSIGEDAELKINSNTTA